jgi:hypothetical protein
MNSRRFIGAPLLSLRPAHTAALREHAPTHRSKIERRMAEMGHEASSKSRHVGCAPESGSKISALASASTGLDGVANE